MLCPAGRLRVGKREKPVAGRESYELPEREKKAPSTPMGHVDFKMAAGASQVVEKQAEVLLGNPTRFFQRRGGRRIDPVAKTHGAAHHKAFLLSDIIHSSS